MYTVIEEIEVNPSHNMSSQINSQASRPDYSQSFRKKYYEDPSEIYPSQPGSIKMFSQEPEDMYQSEPIRQRARFQDPSYHEPQFQHYSSKAVNRSSVKSLMNKAQDSQFIQPELFQEEKPVFVQPATTTMPAVVEEEKVSNKDLQKAIEELKEVVKTNSEFFKDRERRMRNKLKMIENLLKALMLIVILFLFILLLRK